jgi:hypothetical protein
VKPAVFAVSDFVHRWSQRRQVWDGFFPPEDGAAMSRLAVVRGNESSGKTEFLRLLGEMWTRVSGHSAIYVNLHQRDTSNFKHVLNGLQEALKAAKLPSDEIKALDRKLKVSALAPRVREILERITSGQLLVLIDGMHRWNGDVVRYELLESLCAPFGTPDPASRVRVVVALRPEHADTVEWTRDLGVTPIEVGPFTQAEWVRAAALFVRFRASGLKPPNNEHFKQNAWGQVWLKEPGELTANLNAFAPAFLGVVRLYAETLAKTGQS